MQSMQEHLLAGIEQAAGRQRDGHRPVRCLISHRRHEEGTVWVKETQGDRTLLVITFSFSHRSFSLRLCGAVIEQIDKPPCGHRSAEGEERSVGLPKPQLFVSFVNYDDDQTIAQAFELIDRCITEALAQKAPCNGARRASQPERGAA